VIGRCTEEKAQCRPKSAASWPASLQAVPEPSGLLAWPSLPHPALIGQPAAIRRELDRWRQLLAARDQIPEVLTGTTGVGSWSRAMGQPVERELRKSGPSRSRIWIHGAPTGTAIAAGSRPRGAWPLMSAACSACRERLARTGPYAIFRTGMPCYQCNLFAIRNRSITDA
jgi:hypothetical protein